MFTGIIQAVRPIIYTVNKGDILRYAIDLGEEFIKNLREGASVAVDGACQTVIFIEETLAWFEAIEETLSKTTLRNLAPEKLVNIERAATFGSEIGGHILSGHIFGIVNIIEVFQIDHQYKLTIQCPSNWMRYLFPKGFVALDGISLTVGEVYPQSFTVYLIPETLKRTTLGKKQKGDAVNIEFDTQTQIIVDTIERIFNKKPTLLN